MNQKGSSWIFILVIIIIAAGAIWYLLFGKDSESYVIEPASSVAATPTISPSSLATPVATPDVTDSWQIYTNEDGGYTFKYPPLWNVVIHPNTPKGALFGPDAALSGSDGSVEPTGELSDGKSLEDFVKEFNLSIGSGSSSEIEATINGQKAVISILPNVGEGGMEIKSVSFENKKTVFNVSLTYHADFVKYPKDKVMLDNFNKLLGTFKFIN